MFKYHVALTDTDLYKLTMQMAICNLYPNVRAQYTFINRDNRPFPENFGTELRKIVDSFRGYQLSSNEQDFLRDKCYYLSPVYLDFLSGYRYNPAEVRIQQIGETLKVFIEGDWYKTVLWEVPLMATISELYFEMTNQTPYESAARALINKEKAQDLADIGAYYSEFGTRRRFSFDNQAQVVGNLKERSRGFLLGTSNIYLAQLHDLTPMGTLAHEWYSAHAAMFGYLRGNIEASEAWVRVFEGNLGIALPDTFTTDIFYKYGFNTKFAKLFDGVRQDSGSPFDFIDKTVAHYKKLRIQPRLKAVLFSDNLNSIAKIKAIKEYCWKGKELEDRLLDRYGVGTWFSNDCGVKPLNMVIKLTGIDFGHGWVNTVKLSDSPTKHTGESSEIDLCLRTLKIG
jgi:nicotinate phosphoribosyltransferase